MADSFSGDDNGASGGESATESNAEDGATKRTLPKKDSLVLYTQAALSPAKMSPGKKGRRPRTILLKQSGDSDEGKTGQRRPLLKQERRVSTGDRIAMFFSRGAHRDANNTATAAPEIVISGEISEDDEDGAKTPLPVLPVFPPERESVDEGFAAGPGPSGPARDKASKLPNFLKVTKRYRRSSLVRMDAVKQTGRDSLKGTEEEQYRRISVHGSLDLKKNAFKDMSEFRNALSFSAADPKDDDTIAITELHSSGGSNMLEIPQEGFGPHRRKSSKRKRPSLRRLLTISTEPKLNREELEERHNSRRKEREERRKERKERKERKLKEKQRLEEEKYDEEGVSI